MAVFSSADILLPKNANDPRWAVIACDQFTSDKDYWHRVREFAADAPSSVNLILPEAELGSPEEAAEIRKIHETMARYLDSGVFRSYPGAYVYVERTLESGAVRKGIVGMVDLEAYDYTPGAHSAIRATEKTVVERIPPRLRVRRDALLELPHVLMLCDDHENVLLAPLDREKASLPKLYELDLMEGGGHVCGYLVSGGSAAAFDKRLEAYGKTYKEKYRGLSGEPMLFAVGDGNHSLATAKAAFEEWKAAHPGEDTADLPARYALVELENIHDPAQTFEPIHRVVSDTDAAALLRALEDAVGAEDGYKVDWAIGEKRGTIFLDRQKGELAVGVLQNFLDEYLKNHAGTMDYIHDDAALLALAKKENTVGFLLPPMEKSQLFRGVIADGVLPRKTFSMGHAREKRYYQEARRIR